MSSTGSTIDVESEPLCTSAKTDNEVIENEFIRRVVRMCHGGGGGFDGLWADPPTAEERMATRVRYAFAQLQSSWTFGWSSDDTFPTEDLHSLRTIRVLCDSSNYASTCPWLQLPDVIEDAYFRFSTDERILAICHFIESHTALQTIKLRTERVLDGIPSLISQFGKGIIECTLDFDAVVWTYSIDKALQPIARQLKLLHIALNYGGGHPYLRTFKDGEPSMLMNCALGLSENDRLESLTLTGFNPAEMIDILSMMSMYAASFSTARQPLTRLHLDTVFGKDEHEYLNAFTKRLEQSLPCYKATLTEVALHFDGVVLESYASTRPRSARYEDACNTLLSGMARTLAKCTRVAIFGIHGIMSVVGNRGNCTGAYPWNYAALQWVRAVQDMYACAKTGALEDIHISESLNTDTVRRHRRQYPICALGNTYPLEKLLHNKKQAERQAALWTQVAFRVAVGRAATNTNQYMNSVFSRFVTVDEPMSSSSSSSSGPTTQAKLECKHNVEHHIYSFVGMRGVHAHVFYPEKNTCITDITRVFKPMMIACTQCGAKAADDSPTQEDAEAAFVKDCCRRLLNEDRKNGTVWTAQPASQVESDSDDVVIVDQPPVAAAAAAAANDSTSASSGSRVNEQPTRRAKRRFADVLDRV